MVAIRRALRRTAALRVDMLDYQTLVRAAEGLDPVPVSVSRLVSLISRDHWAFSEVEEVIAHDQALTGRLLQVANSAASAPLMPIVTVRDAVVRVGIGPVVSFAMASCLGPTFRRALPEYGLSENDLWNHSVAASLAAEVIAAMAPIMVPPEAVTAALLHDVGKLVLARYLTPELLEGIAEARAGGERSEMQAEIDVLGVHHGELGGVIARHWNLPDRVATAITYHHAPDKIADVVCDAVHLANVTARMVDVPPGASADTSPPSAGALQRLGLSDPALDRICKHVSRRLEDVVARYAVAAQATGTSR
jgi:putative nucleotidyltransferase with HDIG domain